MSSVRPMLVSGALVRVFLTGVGFAAAPVQPCVLHEQQKLIPSDAGESFNVGASVSIDGDTAVVGAWRAIEGNVSSGAAYVLRRDGGCTPAVAGGECWYEEQKLISVDAVSGDLFGWSAAIGGERIVVGARFRTVDVRSGAAFVFRRDKNDTVLDPSDDFWVQESVLSASDAAPSDDFGNSVSISGDWAVVGAPKDDDACPELADCDSGSAYVFRRDDNGTAFDPGDDYWVEEGKLTTPTTVFGDNFGYSVAISGDWAIVGAWQSDINGMESGAAYAFRRVDNDTPADPTDDFWIWDDVLLPEDGAAFDEFGFDVGIDGDRAVVGSWLDDDDGNQSGSAYVFRLDDNDTPFDPTDDLWLEEDKLRADDATAGDEFGKSVSLDGETIVVGSFEDDDACEAEGDPDPHCDSGSAYVFRYTDNGTPLDPGDDHWTQTAKLIASDGATRHFFGRVDVSGQTVIAGSLDDEAGPSAGAAYLYTIALECADLLDIADFQTCILGDGGGVLIGCEVFDLDADLDVDLDDYRLLAPALTGP